MNNMKKKKTLLQMELSTFEIPPAGEALVLAKRCPIGPEAAKRMLDCVAPNPFELIRPDDDLVDGVLVKKQLFLRGNRDSIIEAILEEAKTIMGPECMTKVKCEVTVRVSKEI